MQNIPSIFGSSRQGAPVHAKLCGQQYDFTYFYQTCQ